MEHSNKKPKKNNCLKKKWAEDLNRQFLNKNTQVVNRYMKKLSHH